MLLVGSTLTVRDAHEWLDYGKSIGDLDIISESMHHIIRKTQADIMSGSRSIMPDPSQSGFRFGYARKYSRGHMLGRAMFDTRRERDVWFRTQRKYASAIHRHLGHAHKTLTPAHMPSVRFSTALQPRKLALGVSRKVEDNRRFLPILLEIYQLGNRLQRALWFSSQRALLATDNHRKLHYYLKGNRDGYRTPGIRTPSPYEASLPAVDPIDGDNPNSGGDEKKAKIQSPALMVLFISVFEVFKTYFPTLRESVVDNAFPSPVLCGTRQRTFNRAVPLINLVHTCVNSAYLDTKRKCLNVSDWREGSSPAVSPAGPPSLVASSCVRGNYYFGSLSVKTKGNVGPTVVESLYLLNILAQIFNEGISLSLSLCIF